jgi:phage N-6-adenine-methyltransferase
MAELAITKNTEELERLEGVITRNLQSFYEVGRALAEIRDRGYYRDVLGFETFEEYCKQKWDMGRSYAYSLMDSATVIENVRHGGQVENAPTNERQTRPLARLEPDQQREAWAEAVETAPEGKVTAAIVAKVVKEMTAPPKFADPHLDEIFARKEQERQPAPHVSYNTGENEWYTPPEYIEAARAMMGTIDLDPASSEIANRTVCASEYFTKEDSGLGKPWAGHVFMNPPYSSELIKQFASKFAGHVLSEEIVQGIVLVNNATETAWFRELVDCAAAVVFTAVRVKFLDPQGNPGAPLQGQAIIYFGSYPGDFLSAFSRFGWGAYIP